MIPKRVSLKNFLSFGDDEQALEFTDDEALWVLTGANGVGKSAVFDAITYCLFGEHRAGKQHADNLIRHGANGFRVMFEFELGGVDYRITRTLGSNATHRVERKVGEGWNPIPGVNNAKELNEWVKGTLGLNFDCFTKSVLLRQGQSDDIIEAGGKERLEILKAIIDVKRFEDLSKRIGDDAKKVGNRLEELQRRRDGSTEVTSEQVAAAVESLRKAEETRSRGEHDAKAIAVNGVESADRRQSLKGEEAKLDGLLREADERAAKRNEIHRDHERFALLRLIVPPLEKIAAGHVKVAEADARRHRQAAKLTSLAKELTTAQADAEREKEKRECIGKRKRNARTGPAIWARTSSGNRGISRPPSRSRSSPLRSIGSRRISMKTARPPPSANERPAKCSTRPSRQKRSPPRTSSERTMTGPILKRSARTVRNAVNR